MRKVEDPVEIERDRHAQICTTCLFFVAVFKLSDLPLNRYLNF